MSYLSPEQINVRPFDARVDVFAQRLVFLEGRTLDDPFLHPRFEVVEWLVDLDAFPGAVLQQIALALERKAALPRLDHAALDAEPPIRQRALVIDLSSPREEN